MSRHQAQLFEGPWAHGAIIRVACFCLSSPHIQPFIYSETLLRLLLLAGGDLDVCDPETVCNLSFLLWLSCSSAHPIP